MANFGNCYQNIKVVLKKICQLSMTLERHNLLFSGTDLIILNMLDLIITPKRDKTLSKQSSFVTTIHQTTEISGALQELHQNSNDFILAFSKFVCDFCSHLESCSL